MTGPAKDRVSLEARLARCESALGMMLDVQRLGLVEARLAKLEAPAAGWPRPTVGEVVRDLGGDLRICPPALREQHYAEALEDAAEMLMRVIPLTPADGRAFRDAAHRVRAHKVEETR